jgi:hypothetical protein
MYLPGIKVLQKLIKFSIHVSKSTHQAFESDFYISRAAEMQTRIEIRLELKLFCIKWHIFMTHITIPGVRYGTWIIIPYRFHTRDSFKILSFGASKDRIWVSLSPDTWSTDRTWVHKNHNMTCSSYQDQQDSLFLDQNTAYQNDHQ